MELFLNLCWLSLLLPAFLLWQERAVFCSPERGRRPLIFIATLGCALILLFPVISASDDLHAMRPEMEESERACRDANRCSSCPHALAHSSQGILVSSVSVSPVFEQIGIVLPLISLRIGDFSAPAPAGRAPPLVRPVSL
jgi:hypothetical protein